MDGDERRCFRNGRQQWFTSGTERVHKGGSKEVHTVAKLENRKAAGADQLRVSLRSGEKE